MPSLHVSPTTTTALLQAAPAPGQLYAQHVNPKWVKLLTLLRMNVQYTRCLGAELQLADGRKILDFLSGYCVHNTGHNHPRIVTALKEELDSLGPAMLQSHASDLAGELAAHLCTLAGGGLNKVFFSNSGSEGVEAAIKFARAHTGRWALLSASGGFHGLTCGALSLMDDPFWRANFGPLLAETEKVPFGNLDELELNLSTKRFAAFIVEPIQSEAGVRIPSSEYLQSAQSLCKRHGTLFVLDEVQTGMYRTGVFLAAHHFGLTPDMVVLAKALSGGLVPSGALLMRDSIYDSVYGSLERALVHTTTFGENSLAMRAGLSTLRILEQEDLGKRAQDMGNYLRHRLREKLSKYEMVSEVRGVGLLNGIEFAPPKRLSWRIQFEALRRIHPAIFGQIVVMRLFRDWGILTQICGSNFLVLKVAPPLVIDEAQIEAFVKAIDGVTERMHSSSAFWSEALGLIEGAIHT